ncbi:MAG TPA: SlyX family protein [Nevskiaceae bacterium]|nr:SlyX family protein [Nevskiaceae bacterium]
MNTEDRLVELETRLAYQDEAVRVLSDTVARQQRDLDRLESLYRQVVERLKAQKEALPPNAPEEELPPHY